jgi:hypothetical protein
MRNYIGKEGLLKSLGRPLVFDFQLLTLLKKAALESRFLFGVPGSPRADPLSAGRLG